MNWFVSVVSVISEAYGLGVSIHTNLLIKPKKVY